MAGGAAPANSFSPQGEPVLIYIYDTCAVRAKVPVPLVLDVRRTSGSVVLQ